jgi:WD40 repeat protein
LFSGSSDQTIKVWDLEAGKESLTLRGHAGPVYSLAMLSDGKRQFLGSLQEIKVWNLETGKEALTLRGHKGGGSSLALSSDGKRLFFGDWPTTIDERIHRIRVEKRHMSPDFPKRGVGST